MSAQAIPAKKRKRRQTAQNEHTAPRVTFTNLPFELIGDILLYTCSPTTVLAVSHTCSFLYDSLVRSSSASFIWRGVRETCKPAPLPHPGDLFNNSEAAYATFIFSGGVCEVCKRPTRAMYVSFGSRIRLCGRWPCRRRFISEFLIDITDVPPFQIQFDAVPHVESNLCFYPSAAIEFSWPDYNKLFIRKTDIEKYGADSAAFVLAWNVGDNLAEASQEQLQLLGSGNKRINRFCKIMQFSVQLLHWKFAYDNEYKNIKKRNQTWTKHLAETNGWNLENLLGSQTYSSLQSRKNRLLESLKPNDVNPVRSAIEAELVAMQGYHKRQKAEAAYRGKLAEVKKIYERLRCGTVEGFPTGAFSPSDPTSTLILPPLDVFCSLPFVRTLKGSPDPSTIPANGSSSAKDIEMTLLTKHLIMSDIHAWLIPVQKYLMNLLGYADGWESASTRTLHPLKRVTARFFCKRCGEGKVGRKYQREQCLDFQGVCSHVCTTAQGKKSEGRRSAGSEQGEVDVSDDGDEQEKDRGKRKKNCTKTLHWKVGVFEKDERAIRFVKTILSVTGFSEEEPTTISNLNKGGFIRCLSCAGWIVMDFSTAIGHAHRHKSMRVQLLSQSSQSDKTIMRKDANAGSGRTKDGAIDVARLAFRSGTTELLLGPTYRARKLCKRVDFACRHCLRTENNLLIVFGNAAVGARRMDLNALRSHVKAKHGIQDIRDEDFIYYSSGEESIENDT